MAVDDDLTARLVAASRSFRKRRGRHSVSTPDLAYCAFDTPGFSIPRHAARRDAAARLETFGLDPARIEGRSVLDLGCNAGAMILQLSNFGPSRALGVEYDADKVALAREIAGLSSLSSVKFMAGDLDQLDSAALGTFDVVLALAIEAHVQDKARLFRLLGDVTRDLLCFEGNARCDVEATQQALKDVGFRETAFIGFCEDDTVERFNNRPMIVAQK